MNFDGVKVFSATKHEDRRGLGEAINNWLAKYPKRQIVDRVVTQSSDSAFHCLSIVLFYIEEGNGEVRSRRRRDRRP